MGNLKQRLIKAGRDYNYAEGVKVKATSAVYADQIVYVTASDGPYLSVATADADDATKNIGRLMIAKHDIPINGYGVVLPWKLVTGFNTAAGVVGDPVYLHDTPGTTAASNLTLTPPSGNAKIIVVGRVTIDHASTGAILVNAAAPESREVGGTFLSAGKDVAGTLTFVLDAGQSSQTYVSPPYPIIITSAVIDPGHGSQPVLTVSTPDGDLFVTVASGTNGVISNSFTMTYANCDVAAGTTITCAVSSHNAANTIFMTAIRA